MAKQIDFKNIYLLDKDKFNVSDYLEQAQKDFIDEIYNKRELQVLSALKDHGYVFKNKMEYNHFLKTRCDLMIPNNSKKRILKVDGKVVIEWWETVRFKQDGNTFTCIVGEPPENE